MSYPLPRAPQECWTQWYNKYVEYGSLKDKKIVWVGMKLPCRIKADDVKSVVGPQHVFIVKCETNFEYAVMDSTESMHRLPKKYYTTCFPGIQYSNVPKNNRCVVKLTKKKTVELPYIPDSFLEMKRSKSTRKRRRSESTATDLESLNFNLDAPEWKVLGDTADSVSNKDELMHLIRSVIYYSDSNEAFDLKNEFENITVKNMKDIQRTKMKNIISFIYHYCRDELGIYRERPPMSITDLQSWLAEDSS